jgi:hypothetical protein|tara:strand:- start:282 stop:497 length:216 start_codon:yes stop_codon:yes gene_type:complete
MDCVLIEIPEEHFDKKALTKLVCDYCNSYNIIEKILINVNTRKQVDIINDNDFVYNQLWCQDCQSIEIRQE